MLKIVVQSQRLFNYFYLVQINGNAWDSSMSSRPEASLLNIHVRLKLHNSVTKFMAMIVMNLARPKLELSTSELLFHKPAAVQAVLKGRLFAKDR
jgi:hypothetical protein